MYDDYRTEVEESEMTEEQKMRRILSQHDCSSFLYMFRDSVLFVQDAYEQDSWEEITTANRLLDYLGY